MKEISCFLFLKFKMKNNAYFRYTYSFSSRVEAILSTALPNGQILNDFKWHTILVHQVILIWISLLVKNIPSL